MPSIINLFSREDTNYNLGLTEEQYLILLREASLRSRQYETLWFRLYESNSKKIERWLQHEIAGVNTSFTKDAVQIAFIEFSKRLLKPPPLTRTSLSGYVKETAKNKWLRWQQAKKNHNDEFDAITHDAADDASWLNATVTNETYSQQQKAYNEAVRFLELQMFRDSLLFQPDDWWILTLRIVYGIEYEDIAQAFDVKNIATLRQRVKDKRNLLKKSVEIFYDLDTLPNEEISLYLENLTADDVIKDWLLNNLITYCEKKFRIKIKENKDERVKK